MAITPESIKTGPYTFIDSGLLTFTRNSIATRVNPLGLIEKVPIKAARLDYDHITLAPKGMLIEEERTNLILRSNGFTAWTMTWVSGTTSMDFPIFASEGVWLISADETSSSKFIRRNFASNSALITISVYLRRGTNNFAQLYLFGDLTFSQILTFHLVKSEADPQP